MMRFHCECGTSEGKQLSPGARRQRHNLNVKAAPKRSAEFIRL